MVIMDLKGIAWVGHAYQKFEAMCLEVEELMYQDTVKYVENQVQTVGSSIKRFYSDVIEDLVPPSSLDQVKGKVSNLPREQNSDVELDIRPKIGIKQEALKIDNEKLCEDSPALVGSIKAVGHGQSFHGFHIEDTSFQASSGDIVEGSWFGVYSVGSHVQSGCDQSSICTQKISKEEKLLPSETSGEVPRRGRDLSTGSLSSELMSKNKQTSDDQVSVNPTTVTTEMASCMPIKESNDELESTDKYLSGVLTSSPSVKDSDQIENSKGHSSCSRLSDELTGSAYYLTMDSIESSDVVEQGFETFQRVDNMKFEDSCVLVNVPCEEGKHKPNRMKIQDATSSRMRSARKNEYKQLAVWYDENEKSKLENTKTKGSPSCSSCELEWEFL